MRANLRLDGYLLLRGGAVVRETALKARHEVLTRLATVDEIDLPTETFTGRGTMAHCEYPFFARASERVLTCRLSLGDLTDEQGALYIVAGSNAWADHVAGIRGFDLERCKGAPKAMLTDGIASFAAARGCSRRGSVPAIFFCSICF